jgi:ADP-ribosylglycohydrolase
MKTTRQEPPEDLAKRIAAARKSLDGLSVGDAFGERFFGPPDQVLQRIKSRTFPGGVLRYTDDTVMAISIVEVLERHGHIEQDELAGLFARRFKRDPMRGYGGTAFDILESISRGESWRAASGRAFHGKGSMGNGASMRAGPIGAYYHGKMRAAAENALRSAEITHAHNEGKAGAIAVAAAACHFASGGKETGLFDAVLELVPESETKQGIIRAARLLGMTDSQTAARELGSGNRVLSQDTVPYCLWCAALPGGDFQDTLWTTVAGLGDRDTTCAIVGSIVSARRDIEVPPDWLKAREPLE